MSEVGCVKFVCFISWELIIFFLELYELYYKVFVVVGLFYDVFLLLKGLLMDSNCVFIWEIMILKDVSFKVNYLEWFWFKRILNKCYECLFEK